MNTISIPASSRPLMWRFAWKEYRMLRGFWLAGFVVACGIQALGRTVLHPPSGDVQQMFGIAWAAAALYSVGAAITIFCAETEERTRDYLRLLPADWKPIFATKVLMAMGSAILLGCALSLTGWWLADYRWPTASQALHALGIVGVAALEFLAWGLLFSMWWKHPLMAAVAAIATASLSTQATIAMTVSQASWTEAAYVEAVPGRLAICLVVFAVDVWLGRRWLYPAPTRGRAVTTKPASGVAAARNKAERPRLKMFARLLWQTWRESWKAILVSLPLSFALVVVPAGILEQFAHLRESFTYLIPPALLGALAFRADWQRDHRLFLATHGAFPRYVWFARHAVWLGTVLLLAAVATLGVIYLFEVSSGQALREALGSYERNPHFFSGNSLAREINRTWGQLRSGILTAWCAVITAYGIGQLCSMQLKQTVLSGFAAILLSIVLAAWSILMFAWQMNPWWFVLPIGVGAMLATWLRVPSWILQRNQWKHFAISAGAVALPLTLAVLYVPSARMAQIENIKLPTYHFLREPLVVSVREFSERLEAQEQSLLKLEQLGVSGGPWIGDVLLDGKMLADFELSDRAIEFYSGYAMGIDENLQELEPTEVEILDRFQSEATRLGLEANRAKIPELLEILNSSDFVPIGAGSYGLLDRYTRFSLLKGLASLLANDAQRLTAEGDLDEAWQRLRAIPLIDTQDKYGDQQFDFYKDVVAWAAHPDQTSDRLKHAIVDLQQVFARLPSPRDPILANREHVRAVVMDGEPSRRYPATRQIYYFLNSLPGEKQRALRALDLLTAQALNQIDAVTSLAADQSTQPGTAWVGNVGDLLKAFRRGIRAEFYNGSSKEHAEELEQAFSTSYLAASEVNYGGASAFAIGSNWNGEETRRRALLVQLALIAYRLDYGIYPRTLAELTPGWLAEPIDDPFSGRPFLYRPEGLPHKLLATHEDKLTFIAPGTPLIWSAGSDNMQLAEAEPMERIVKRFGGPNSVDEDILSAAAAGEQYFFFHDTRRRGSNPFVFLLPKIADKPAQIQSPEEIQGHEP